MERNIDNIAVEMILEAMKQGQPVVVYGTGTSMEPTICRGDAITVVPCKDIRVGDIVLIFLALDCLVVHRVIDIGTLWGGFMSRLRVTTIKNLIPAEQLSLSSARLLRSKKFPTRDF